MQPNAWDGVNAIGFVSVGVFLLSWLCVMAMVMPAVLRRRVPSPPLVLVGMLVAALGIGALFIGVTFGGLPTE